MTARNTKKPDDNFYIDSPTKMTQTTGAFTIFNNSTAANDDSPMASPRTSPRTPFMASETGFGTARNLGTADTKAEMDLADYRGNLFKETFAPNTTRHIERLKTKLAQLRKAEASRVRNANAKMDFSSPAAKYRLASLQ